MAETPSQSPPPSRSVSETETVTEEAPQEYWCYHCDKRVSVETVANLPDIVCHDCKNGFVESIPRSDPPSQPSDQASDPYGSPFLQVLRLFAQAARDEDAPPPLPQNRTSEEDFLRIELDGWDNDEDEDDDAHSVEFHNEGGVENEEAEVVEEDEEGRSDREEDENQERDEEDLRRRRRDVLRLRIRDFATRAQSGRNQILDWAQILMGLEDNSIELRFEMPGSDRYVGNPEDYVDAAGYEALLQTLAESDGSGRRGAPPASKAAVSELPAVDEAVVCAICKDKELKESYKELTKWWKGALASDNVDDVKISNRLADTPCVVVTSKFGWSANMEKIMQSQTLSDSAKQAYMRGKRVLEINPRHPIIKELRERVVKNPEDESVKHTAQLIYQTALMESGFVLPDPKDFASRIYSSVKSSLNINPDATVEEEIQGRIQPSLD